MREGYGKSKLFFVVVIAMAGILLLPYGGLFPAQSGSKQAQSEPADVADEEVTAGDAEKVAAGSKVLAQETSLVRLVVRADGAQINAYAITAESNAVVFAVTEEEVWFVTAGHVFDHADENAQVSVELENGEAYSCTDWTVAEEADLAFLRIDQKLPIQPAKRPEKASYDAMQTGDFVQAICMLNGQRTVYGGTLSEPWIYSEDFAQYMMTAVCEVHAGMSGCGLYDADGSLIGIVCGGDDSGTIAAVPLHLVEAVFANQ